jgi:PhnB protein
MLSSAEHLLAILYGVWSAAEESIMREMITYLTFDGNCREAMEFYGKCLGAHLELMPFSDGPGGAPGGAKDRIMHARLTKGSAKLMASDTMPGMPFQQGTNFSISIDCESAAEIDQLFAALGEKGKATMQPQDTFWGAYFGMLTDQFGVNWMLNFDKPQQGNPTE